MLNSKDKRRKRLSRKVELKAACQSGKKRYRTVEEAEIALAKIQAGYVGDRAKIPQRAYDCPYCAGAHLASLRTWNPARTPLPKASTKRQKEQRQRSKMLREKFPERPMCARPGCNRWADDPHEPLTRARGGSIVDPENVVALCRQCHDEVTFSPESELGWAYEIGLLVHSWERGEAS